MPNSWEISKLKGVHTLIFSSLLDNIDVVHDTL
jgi:hypothetical protein